MFLAKRFIIIIIILYQDVLRMKRGNLTNLPEAPKENIGKQKNN